MSIMRSKQYQPGFIPLTLVACRLLFWPRSAFYSGVKTMRYPALRQIVWLGYGKKNHTFIYLCRFIYLCSGLYASDVCMYIYIYMYMFFMYPCRDCIFTTVFVYPCVYLAYLHLCTCCLFVYFISDLVDVIFIGCTFEHTSLKEVLYTTVHQGRLTWNLRMHPWKGKTSSKPSFSGSMLIFGGVCHSSQGLPGKIAYEVVIPRILPARSPAALQEKNSCRLK